MKKIDVPYLDQSGQAPTGCESVSAVMLLRYLGYPVTIPDFLDHVLERGVFEKRGDELWGSDPRQCFVGQGALLVRSAGNFAQLTSREGSYCVIKLPSGETRQVLSACKATVGSVGNSDHALEQSGKAGRSRWLGRRPHNRGVVMNPVDHPMGGGEGRQSGGHPRSRKGLYAKGLKTRAPKKLSNKYIIERAIKK